ncbi:MAG: hypothetical protein ACNA8H_04185 [Anaerolineales bacterium]
MKPEVQSQSFPVIILIILLVILGLGGLGGGIAMLIDPSGQMMGLPTDMLDGLPITNFILPGLFLILIMGIMPIANGIALWKSLPGAWIASLSLGILLVLWIFLQIYLWGDPVAIQYIYLVWGLLIAGLSLLPQVRKRSSS